MSVYGNEYTGYELLLSYIHICYCIILLFKDVLRSNPLHTEGDRCLSRFSVCLMTERLQIWSKLTAASQWKIAYFFNLCQPTWSWLPCSEDHSVTLIIYIYTIPDIKALLKKPNLSFLLFFLSLHSCPVVHALFHISKYFLLTSSWPLVCLNIVFQSLILLQWKEPQFVHSLHSSSQIFYPLLLSFFALFDVHLFYLFEMIRPWLHILASTSSLISTTWLWFHPCI